MLTEKTILVQIETKQLLILRMNCLFWPQRIPLLLPPTCPMSASLAFVPTHTGIQKHLATTAIFFLNQE